MAGEICPTCGLSNKDPQSVYCSNAWHLTFEDWMPSGTKPMTRDEWAADVDMCDGDPSCTGCKSGYAQYLKGFEAKSDLTSRMVLAAKTIRELSEVYEHFQWSADDLEREAAVRSTWVERGDGE